MCWSLQLYKTSEKNVQIFVWFWDFFVFFFVIVLCVFCLFVLYFFGLTSNLENPVLKLLSYVVIPQTTNRFVPRFVHAGPQAGVHYCTSA